MTTTPQQLAAQLARAKRAYDAAVTAGESDPDIVLNVVHGVEYLSADDVPADACCAIVCVVRRGAALVTYEPPLPEIQGEAMHGAAALETLHAFLGVDSVSPSKRC